MSAELNAAPQAQERLAATPKPTEPPVPTKTENGTDPDPYCCTPGPGDGGPDT